ncbi:carboxypeptidase Y-deficient [Lunasporangiospora selenospora]|uniref:Carboxypeptidase Y-deficient n=1 Tax=Lunasporangiospora selenospora TaxID=979761 RepID=A0A9P6G2I3_9FUNG|nr:carboxypeptidase Y-deficient [Lunasporangiospora selenospora]
MAANATHAQFHQRSASTPQQLHPQHAQAPSTPAHAQTIGRPRRQFGPPPGSVSQAELLATSPGKGGPGGASPATTPNSATPPPRSPNARPAMTTSNGLGSPGTASMHGNQGQPVICPICNITVRNLALLNQHLDSIHPEETDDVKSAVTAFFKNAQKVLNPITKNAATTLKNIPANSSELLRKIQDLDLDVATNSPGNSLVGPAAPGSFLGWTDPRAETMVTKRHWVRESDQDICFHRNCEKSLGLRSGRQNCRW